MYRTGRTLLLVALACVVVLFVIAAIAKILAFLLVGCIILALALAALRIGRR